jgi:N-methylhydantoinase B
VIGPDGCVGGKPGRTGAIVINPEGASPVRLPTRYADYPLKDGDIVRLDTPGGGGFGDPLTREPERVLADLREGYISVAATERYYGVVLVESENALAIDEDATGRKRASLKIETDR